MVRYQHFLPHFLPIDFFSLSPLLALSSFFSSFFFSYCLSFLLPTCAPFYFSTLLSLGALLESLLSFKGTLYFLAQASWSALNFSSYSWNFDSICSFSLGSMFSQSLLAFFTFPSSSL